MANVTDTFARADSPSSLGTADTGQTWTIRQGVFGIVSQTVYAPSGSTLGIATIPCDADTVVLIQVTHIDTRGNSGIVFRWTDNNNYWRLFADGSGAIFLQKVSGGTASTVWSGSSFAAGDQIGASLNGSTIKVLKNNAVLTTVTDAFNSTSAAHGLWLNEANDFWRLDNFSAHVPAVITPGITIGATTIIRHGRSPDRSITASFHRRHQYAFLPPPYLRLPLEYLYANVGVKFVAPSPFIGEYFYWNIGIFGTNIRDLYVPFKRWPLQPASNTLAFLSRPSTPLDQFVADLYEAIGNVLARPEYTNYTSLEQYSDQLRKAGVADPATGPFKLPRSYETFDIKAAIQSVLADYPDVPNAEAIARHIESFTIEHHIKKTRIFFAIQRWSHNSPARLATVNTQPDYLSHRIEPIPHIPDDLQYALRNIRNRMALHERTNLIRVQHWAQERFLNIPGSGIEYFYWDIISSAPVIVPGSGVSGGIIGQALAFRTASGLRVAGRRRGRVYWP